MRDGVDLDHSVAKAQIDILVGPEFLRANHDPLEGLVAGEVFLGKRWALIGRMRVAPDHEDRFLVALLAQGDRGLCAAMPRTDDHHVSGARCSRLCHYPHAFSQKRVRVKSALEQVARLACDLREDGGGHRRARLRACDHSAELVDRGLVRLCPAGDCA